MAKRTQTEEGAPLFDPEDAIAAAGVFNTTREVMAGALHGVAEPLTQEDIATKLDAYLNKPVERGQYDK